jgi:hypothetical protein
MVSSARFAKRARNNRPTKSNKSRDRLVVIERHSLLTKKRHFRVT